MTISLPSGCYGVGNVPLEVLWHSYVLVATLVAICIAWSARELKVDQIHKMNMTFITCCREMFITWLNTEVGASVYSGISPLGVNQEFGG